jgi:hypothetical protein
MPNDDRGLLDVLKSELAFLEQGGYGRSVRTPWKPTIMFRDSPTCLNFNDPSRPNPCSACHLMQFVPAKYRTEDVPCHHIPLDDKGETAEGYEHYGTQAQLEEATAQWLRKIIARIERERVQKLD